MIRRRGVSPTPSKDGEEAPNYDDESTVCNSNGIVNTGSNKNKRELIIATILSIRSISVFQRKYKLLIILCSTIFVILILINNNNNNNNSNIVDKYYYNIHGDSCLVDPSSPMVKRIPIYQNQSLALRTVPGSNNNNDNNNITNDKAICQFIPSFHSPHFPHAMQQIYQCWSYFQLNKDKQSILVIPYEAKGFPGIRYQTIRDKWRKITKFYDWSNFLHGLYYTLLEAPTNITIVESNTYGLPAVERSKSDNRFYIQSPKHADLLRDIIINHYKLLNTTNERISQYKCPNTKPKIIILNRMNYASRVIQNYNAIANAIQKHFNYTEKIQTIHFEKATFIEQVQIFVNTDIIISSHGAALTNIPFLPICGSILEIFPKYYYYNTYFGSLSDVSGKTLYTLYLSNGNSTIEYEYIQTLNSKQRRKFRNVNLCINITTIIKSIQQIINDWYKCCNNV